MAAVSTSRSSPGSSKMSPPGSAQRSLPKMSPARPPLSPTRRTKSPQAARPGGAVSAIKSPNATKYASSPVFVNSPPPGRRTASRSRSPGLSVVSPTNKSGRSPPPSRSPLRRPPSTTSASPPPARPPSRVRSRPSDPSPGGRGASNSPGGRGASNSPGGRIASNLPGGRRASNSPGGRRVVVDAQGTATRTATASAKSTSSTTSRTATARVTAKTSSVKAKTPRPAASSNSNMLGNKSAKAPGASTADEKHGAASSAAEGGVLSFFSGMFGGGNSGSGASSPERVVEPPPRVAAPPTTTSSSAATKNLFLSTSEEEKLTKSLRHLLAEADSLRGPSNDHDVLGGLSALVDVDGSASLSTLQDSDKQMTAALQLLRLNLQARNAAFDQNLHHLTKQLRLVTVATQDFATEQLATNRKTLEAKDEELALVKTEFEREKRKKKESTTIYKELKERYDALWKQFEAGQDALLGRRLGSTAISTGSSTTLPMARGGGAAISTPTYQRFGSGEGDGDEEDHVDVVSGTNFADRLSQVDALMHDRGRGEHDHGQRTGSRRSDRKRDGIGNKGKHKQLHVYYSDEGETESKNRQERPQEAERRTQNQKMSLRGAFQRWLDVVAAARITKKGARITKGARGTRPKVRAESREQAREVLRRGVAAPRTR